MIDYFMQSCVIHLNLCHQSEARVYILLLVFRVDSKDTIKTSNEVAAVYLLLNVMTL